MNNTYKENFSHNDMSIGSHNRVSVKAELAAASGTGITLAVIFVISLTMATIIYLALVHLALLDFLIVASVIGGCALLVFNRVNHMIREIAKTKAACSYYKAQSLRNNLIEARSGVVVLHDPHERYRVENARDIAETYHINEKPPAALPEAASDKRPVRLSQLLNGSMERENASNP